MDPIDERLAAQLGTVLRGHDADIREAALLPRSAIRRIHLRRATFAAVLAASLIGVALPLAGLSGLGRTTNAPAGHGNVRASSGSMPGVVVATGRGPDGSRWRLSNKPFPDGSPHIYFAFDGMPANDFGSVKVKTRSGKVTATHEVPEIPGPGQALVGPTGSITAGGPGVWFGFARSDVASYAFRQTHGIPVPRPILPIPVPLPSGVANGIDAYLVFTPGDFTFAGTLTALDARARALGSASVGQWEAWSPAATADERAAQELLHEVLMVPDAGDPGSLAGWNPVEARSIDPTLVWNDSTRVVPGQVSIRDATSRHVLFVVGSPAGHAYCLEVYATGSPGSTAVHMGTGDVTAADACRGGWPFPGT